MVVGKNMPNRRIKRLERRAGYLRELMKNPKRTDIEYLNAESSALEWACDVLHYYSNRGLIPDAEEIVSESIKYWEGVPNELPNDS